MAGFGPAIARSPDRNSIVCWVGEDSAVHAMAFDDSMSWRPACAPPTRPNARRAGRAWDAREGGAGSTPGSPGR
jgi:hypothetical protein